VKAYIPLLMLIVFVIANAIMMIVLSHVLSATRTSAYKDQPYESGMPVLQDSHARFDVKYYMVAIIFIVFDIEVVFMLPWAAAFRQLDLFGLGMMGALIEMGLFVLILLVGYLYILKRGALEWT
jgi:NADH-quinone oxidoreductase subunit A